MYVDHDITEFSKDTAYNTDQLLALLGMVALLPPNFDFVECIPPALPTTINYRLGGALGVIVRQLTLVYVGSDLSTVTRTI
ncbi:MAG: hypothetical protein PHX83_14570 [Acidobacteriia bacterium]|nr:hypothetical protein [Terriglobia bacterium]